MNVKIISLETTLKTVQNGYVQTESSRWNYNYLLIITIAIKITIFINDKYNKRLHCLMSWLSEFDNGV